MINGEKGSPELIMESISNVSYNFCKWFLHLDTGKHLLDNCKHEKQIFFVCFCQFWHARQKLKCYNLHGRNINWCWGREKKRKEKRLREGERKKEKKRNNNKKQQPRSTEMINGWWNVVNRNTNNFTSQNPNKNTAWRHNRTEHFAYNFHYKPSPDQ